MSESLNTQELTDNSLIIPIPTESTDAAQDIISVSNEDTTTTTTTIANTTTTESRVRKSSSPNEENDKKRSKKEFHSRQK